MGPDKIKRGRRKKTPYIEISPLGDKGEMDFFPELSAGKGNHGDAIRSLKNGTYKPYMAALEYKPNFDFEKKTFSASVINQDIIASPDDREFTAEIDGNRAKELAELYQNERVPLRRRYYANPRQYYDIILLADGYTNNFAGTVIDTWTDFTIPREIMPVLKLRRPSGDQKADGKKIRGNQDIIDKLIGMDMWYSDLGPKKVDSYFDVPFQQKLKAAFTQREVFGRVCLVKEKWKHLDPVTVDGEEIKEAPNTFKLLHPVEMGITEIELYTGKLAGLWIQNDQPYIPAEDMIYFLNMYSSPQIGTASYGFSKLQRSIDQVRLYRRLMAKNFPQFLRTSASGMGAFVINTTGYAEDDRKKIRNDLKNSYKAAEISVIDYANIDNFSWQEFKINTDIGALVQLEQAMLQTIANVIGVPQSIILDAGSPARATLVGRILTFMNNNVQQARVTFGQQIASQHWMPNFRLIADKNQLEEFYIEAEFEDVSFETKQEKIDRLLMETELNPYTDEYLGQELEDPDYINHIDAEKKAEQEKMNQMGGPQGTASDIASKGPAGGGAGKSKNQTFSTRDHATGERKTFSQR